MWNHKSSGGFTYRPKLKIWTDGANNEFNPETFEARSYRHWCYVARIKGKVVFNAYTYSNTTTRHQSHMRQLLSQLKIKIDIEVDTRSSLTQLDQSVLVDAYCRLYENEIKLSRTKKYQKSYEGMIKECKSQIEAIRSLGYKYSKAEQKSLKETVLAADLKDREYAKGISKAKREKVKDALNRAKLDLNNMSPIDLVFTKIEEVNELDLNQLLTK